MNHINTIIYIPLILILGTRSIYTTTTTTTTTTILLYNIQYSIYNDEDIEQQ